MIPVYKAEYELGLGKDITENNSIAYISKLSQVNDVHTNIDFSKFDHPNLAKADRDDWDLYRLDAILASIGWNQNDDVFDAGETWLAKSSPVNKKFNFMHDETDIIGHMIASVIFDEDGNIVPNDVEELPTKYDIIVSSVLYRRWSDESLQTRMDDIIKGIADDKWFVSMECLFSNFDYAIIRPNGQHDIISRTGASAFLTKHLRVYGGTGEFEGNKIGRLLRNFTFSGKGLVDNPANKRSIIFNDRSLAFIPQLVIAETQANTENKMDTSQVEIQLRNDLVARDSELAKSNARTTKLEDKVEEMVEAARTEEKAKLNKLIASLQVDIEDRDKKIQDLGDSTKAVEKELKDSNFKVSDLEKDITKAKETIETTESEKVLVARISDLVDAGVDKDEASKIASKWSEVSDEQFADVVALHTESGIHDNGKKDKEKKGKKEEKAESTVDVEDLDNVKLEQDADLSVADVDNSEERVQSATAFVSQWLSCSDKSKK